MAVGTSVVQDDFWLFCFAPLIVYMIFYWTTAAVCFLLDLWLFQRDHADEWKIQTGQTLDLHKYLQTSVTVLCQQLLINAPVGIMLYPLWRWRGVCYSCPLPSYLECVLHLAVAVLCVVPFHDFHLVDSRCFDLFFFHVHRWLHSWRYATVHKRHHEWVAPVGVAAHYAHPLEHLIANTLPMGVGPLLTGMHFKLFLFLVAVASVNVVKSHAGFDWFFGSPGHDAHHELFTVNYGVTPIFDTFYGSYCKSARNASVKKDQPDSKRAFSKVTSK
mmetsp:Transcript_5713/g.12573  ORF Transcript_5713/g.12573 Transcript_5713/m.12573 type:complete len:273 (+) Transcript_5713:1-819(+)